MGAILARTEERKMAIKTFEVVVKTRPYSTRFSRAYDALREMGFPRLAALEAVARGYRK